MNENEIEWLEDFGSSNVAFVVAKLKRHEKFDTDYWVFYAGRFWDGDENMWTDDIYSSLIFDFEEAEECLKKAQKDSPNAVLRKVQRKIGHPNYF